MKRQSRNKSVLERFVERSGITKQSISVLWNCSTMHVSACLRRPGELPYIRLHSLAALLKLPVIAIIGLVAMDQRKQTGVNWLSEQMDVFYIDYELFFECPVDIEIVHKGRVINTSEMRDKAMSKRGSTLSTKIKHYNSQVKEYLKVSEPEMVYKTDQSLPLSGSTFEPGLP